ncbi:MAG: serine/threonine-protein kinase [Pleurocapsa sp.]
MKQQLKYKILTLIGCKASNRIFSAFDVSNGQLVALKELDNYQIYDQKKINKLNFILSLDHPNIVAYKHLEYTENISYLVMDYGEGGSLRQLITSGNNCSLDRNLQLIIDILSGLEYAHNRGIVHGNLKPENILLKLNNNNWKAQIADFNLINFKALRNSDLTEESLIYQAPEQLDGWSSYRSDLYGVGIILFELLTGKPPVIRDSVSQLLQENCIPLILHSALAKALQPQPQKRFPHAGKMLESIQLAKEILNKTQPKLALQLSVPSDRITTLKVISKEELSNPVTYLAINSQQVYLETKNCLCGKLYSDSTLTGQAIKEWQIFLDGYLDSLEIRPQGCFALTKSASMYYLPQKITTEQFNFFSKTSLPIFSLPAKKLITAIDPQGTWLGLVYLANKIDNICWEILQLPSLKVVGKPNLLSLPSRIIALNRRYGLAVFSEKEQGQHTTILQLFNRRGHCLGNYSLSVALRLITYNPQYGDRLFALEGGQNHPIMGLLIDLKPLRVTRILLPFLPSFIIPQTRGYLLCDRLGNMAIVNGKDNSLTQFKIPIDSSEKITAIAADLRCQLLVATWSKSGGNLWQLSI